MELLQVRDLVKTYRTPEGTEQVVLDIPSFDLAAGREIAMEGRSGSGKTTFLNLVAGILRADGGSIHLDGEDMASLPETGRDDLRARTLGYVFQTFNLLQGYTALENVLLGMMFGPGPDPDAAAALLTELGLGDRLHYQPRQMSIGQQQRVALARALANRPRLVLADEPTGNLDAENAAEALDRIRSACSEHGASLLLVSHDRVILDAFEDVVRLEDLHRKSVP